MSYPTTPDFTTLGVSSVQNNLKSETRSGKHQIRTIGAQRWAFTASYRLLTRAQFAPVWAYVISQEGMLNPFTIVAPVISHTSGTATGTLRVNNVAGYAAGTSVLAVDGIAGTLKAGDFIKFNGHTKVYMVVSDLTGVGSLTITPELTENVVNDEIILYRDVPFTMRLKNDVQEFSTKNYDQFDFELDFIEVL